MTACSLGGDTPSTSKGAAWASAAARLVKCQLAAPIAFVALCEHDRIELIGFAGAALETAGVADALARHLPALCALADGPDTAPVALDDPAGPIVAMAFGPAATAWPAAVGERANAGGRGLIGAMGAAPPDTAAAACLADLASLVAAQVATARALAAAESATAAAAERARAAAFRERRLRAAFDGLPQHLWITDADGRYVEQNARDREVFGNLVGRAAHEVEPPLEQAARWQAHHRRVLDGETLQFSSWREQPGEPAARFVETVMAPLELDGTIVGHVGVTIDRTEQAAIERRLAESEGRLKAALDALPFPFFICDAEGRHVMQNSIDRDQWGDALGKTHAELDLPAELLAYMPEVTASMRAGVTFRTMQRYPIAGQLRDIEEIYAPVHAEGRVTGFVGIAIDHTERAVIERRLAEREAQLHAALDALPYPFFIYDADGYLRVNNKVDRAIWGDHTGRHFEAIGLPSAVVEEMRRAFAAVLGGDTHKAMLHYDLAGRPADVEEVFAPVYTDDRVTSVVGLVIDHTDRMAAERRLRQSEAHLKSIIDALPCALFVCDLAGRHVLQNSIDKALWGDCIGKTYAELDLPAEIAAQVPTIIERVRAGQTMRSQVGYERDGKRVEIEEIYAPVYDAEAVVGFVGLAVDHTDRVEAERRVRRSEARLADYLSTASDWLWETDAEHRITRLDGWPANAAVPPEFLIGKRRWELAGVDPTSDPHWRSYHDDVVARRPFRGFVYGYPRPDRATIWVEVSGNPMFDEEGVFLGYRGTARDVTARCLAEAALREAHGRIEALSASGLIGIIAGRGFLIEEANDAFLAMVGRDRSALEGGLDWRSMRPADQREQAVAEALEPKASGSVHAVERDYLRPDGSCVPTLLSIVVLDAEERRWFALVQDLSAMKAAEARVRELAERDVLTGLANRHVLFEQLKGDLDERRQPGGLGALFMLDLDDFKEINDTLGHEAGDRLLQTVAARISAVVRESDTIARLGGDEFALVLRRLGGPVAAAEVATKLLGTLGEPLELEGREIRPKGSIGIALFPGDGNEAAELLRKADIALYQAKAEGRGTFRFFEPALLAGLERRRQIATALEASVVKDDFSIALQPQLHLASGAQAGIEALVRWQLDGRPVPPGDFINIAVESGTILPLGRLVRRHALEAWRHCLDVGIDPGRLAVNVAAVELKQAGFAEQLAALLADARMPPERLEIEVTEGALFDRDAATVAQTLAELRRLGVGITLDDFGTGYASLTHLKRFPVDRLKIDRSFVRDIGVGEAAGADAAGGRALDPADGDALIVRSIINLAHTLGLTVVAEGVETAAQEAFLRQQGCDLAQGFHFSPPLEPAAFERYLARVWARRVDGRVAAVSS